MNHIHIKPQVKDLGGNFKVRRLLPSLNKRMIGPFVFWDHMGPVELEEGNDMFVRTHPHIGLATITYLFAGEILHRDSLGNEQVIRPGEVNWMTAGSGIVHSERSFAKKPPERLEGIQLWVALPRDAEDIDASFVHEKEGDLPLFEYQEARLRLIAGNFHHNESPLPVYSKLFYLQGEIDKSSQFRHKLGAGEEAGIYIVNGSIEVDGIIYNRFDMVSFDVGSELCFTSTEKTEFMLLGGKVFAEKRHVWWNFVSSDIKKIENAKKRWVNKEFPEVVNETEFIPLPEK